MWISKFGNGGSLRQELGELQDAMPLTPLVGIQIHTVKTLEPCLPGEVELAPLASCKVKKLEEVEGPFQ